ncbi:hypothetical protein ACXX83_06570 [Pseudomonas sp. GNP012]
MTGLIVKKLDGSLLFDTSKITYGLVKSGNLAYISNWGRRGLKSPGLDKNDGASWTAPTEIVANDNSLDIMHGFTLANFKSPIVFLVGPGCLNGSTQSGTSITFYYVNASPSTKYYCFDLMADNIAGSPYLKTFDTSGNCTFNSLQPALNIIGTQPPPAPSSLPYTGGTNQMLQTAGTSASGRIIYPRAQCTFTYNLTAGVEYAAHLPWSRGCGLTIGTDLSPIAQASNSGCVEGVYGGTGFITFMMANSAASTYDTQILAVNGYQWQNIPTLLPTALIIRTANLPFPFG